MTDDPTTARPDDGADPLDDLATAIVDGTATPEEQARADESVVAERIAAHRAVAERLAAPPAPSGDARREQAIAAALAAFDDERTPAETAAPVAALASRPPERRTNRDRQRRWLTAAAVVAVLAIAVPVLANLEGTDDDEAATGANDTATESAGGSADTTVAAEAGDGEDETAAQDADDQPESSSGDEEASNPLEEGELEPDGTEGQAPSTGAGATGLSTDLGGFDDIDALLAAAGPDLTARAAAPLAPSDTSPPGGGDDLEFAPFVEQCADRRLVDEPDSTVDARAAAVLDGLPVVVLLVDSATTPRLLVLDADGCAVIADRAL